MRGLVFARRHLDEDVDGTLGGRGTANRTRSDEFATPLTTRVLTLQGSYGNTAVSGLLAGADRVPNASGPDEDEDTETPTEGSAPAEWQEPAPDDEVGGSSGDGGEWMDEEDDGGPVGGTAGPGGEWTEGKDDEGDGEGGSEGEGWTEGRDDEEEDDDGEGAGYEVDESEPDLVVDDPFLPLSGGGPVASSEGFSDLGRIGSSPAGGPVSDDPHRPHAFVDGGSTGSARWSGGGPGGGPKGNEAAGSTQNPVQPRYVSRSNGLKSDSEAWVTPGTGTIDVVRQWFGAEPGDQGTGWYVTEAAAARLNQHETLHVQKSRELYGQFLDPMMKRMMLWGPEGNHARAYLQWSAVGKLQAALGWDKALENFFTQDFLSNVNGGTVDQDDTHSGSYPQRFPSPQKPEEIYIGGKRYDSLLKMPGEKTPA